MSETDAFQFDPFHEAEQFFNRQMELLDKSFNEPETGMPGIQTSDLFEGESLESVIMPDETLSDEFLMEEQTLEQILHEQDPFDSPASGLIEQGMTFDNAMADMNMPGAAPELTVFDIDPAIDEINQAIDEVTQQAMPQEEEPDPFQPQFDPYMMGQNMFDQMQYMANPFMMPGPYGPMGSIPGPMPGP
jgi:hypothetical protein